MYKTRLFDLDKWITDVRDSMFHEAVHESSFIYEINDGIITGELFVSGFKKDELSIKAHPKYLEISGKMEKRYRRVKPTFYVKVPFSQRIDPESMKITLENGMLIFNVSLEEGKEVKIIDF